MRIRSPFARKVLCNLPGFHPTLLGRGVKFGGVSDLAAGVVAMTIVGVVDQAVNKVFGMALQATNLAVADEYGNLHLRGSPAYNELTERNLHRRQDEERQPRRPEGKTAAG